MANQVEFEGGFEGVISTAQSGTITFKGAVMASCKEY